MKPFLEALEDRLVLSTVDLTVAGTDGTINGALFQQCDAQPTGTGYIRSFVRVQGANANASIEQGYNTDARPLTMDENKSPQFTRSLLLGQVPLTSHDGTLYREFLLDINQSSSKPLLSLDELRIYIGDQPNLSGYNATDHTLAGLAPVYDMGEGNWVKLNYRLNAGSGSGDVFVNVPASMLGSDGSKYVYVYSKFGVNLGANSGFEEWAVRTNAGDNNPTGNSSLAGRVFNDLNKNGTQELDEGEVGIEGVIIQLQGIDDRGENVVLTARTISDGTYRFSDLRAGIYSLLEVQPDGYEDGIDSIGTQGGSTDTDGNGDRFFDIFLAAGVDGEENNFAEFLMAGSGG